MIYNIEFANRLIEAAAAIIADSHDKQEAGRTVLYLSCLSCEISLKALLEQVGYEEIELKKISHRLDELLKLVGDCEFPNGQKATAIRSKMVVPETQNGTVGTILSKTSECSVYPNEIRYGSNVRHYHPKDMLNCAKVVSQWCTVNSQQLKR